MAGAEVQEPRRRPRRGLRGPRLVAVLATVAVIALGTGIAVSKLVVSPAELAARAEAPVAGPIFAPVEKRVIENRVTTRADVSFADAVDVTIDASTLSGPAVVTGHVPEAGATIDAAGVALEVAGRPVIALPGALPSYRTLRSGMSGPDVLQLRTALSGLGIAVGDPGSASYDASLAAGVDELYRRTGYTPPAAAAEAESALRSARSAERAAEAALEQARVALDRASSTTHRDAQVEADNAVRQAQRALDAALATNEEPGEIDRLRDELALASARQESALAPPDASAETAAVTAAEQQLADARDDRSTAETEALTPLPAAEVLFLPTLPRRVDSVAAVRGEVAKGVLMSVSGAALHLVGSVTESDAALLKAGMPASFSGSEGSAFPATVTGVEVDKTKTNTKDGAAASYDVTLDPGALAPEVVDRLRGTNVKVDIPVQATDGAVLAVPVAALSAGASGESRVELEVEHPDAPSTTELVTVTTGLAADGYVEVRSDDRRLDETSRVVVGR